MLHRYAFFPMATAQGGVTRLEAPWDKRSKAAGLFLQFVHALEMINPMLKSLAYSKHHGCGGAHAQLVRGAVDVEPVVGQAFQARNFVTHFVVQDLRAAAGDRV